MFFKFFLTVLSFSIFSSTMVAQRYNKNDAQGARHGVWKKYYEGTQQLRYQGTFDHGKETGVFEFYSEKSGAQPTATKTYTSGTDEVVVAYFRESGKKISQGTMLGRQRVGSWEYYQKDGKSLMTTESYREGLLDGERTVYFPNGQIAQKQRFILGKEEGEDKHYNENGVLLKSFTYANGLLEGPVQFYTATGILEREGRYKANKKHGSWKYYKGGVLEKTVKFPQNKIGIRH